MGFGWGGVRVDVRRVFIGGMRLKLEDFARKIDTL